MEDTLFIGLLYVLSQWFLKFAENWTIPRFTYGASLGYELWDFPEIFDIQARQLLKKLKVISIREKGAVNLVQNHLGIRPLFLLEPTILIDKKII